VSAELRGGASDPPLEGAGEGLVVGVADGRRHEVDLHLLVPEQPHRRHDAPVFDVVAQPQPEVALESRGEVVAAQALLALDSARIEALFEEVSVDETESGFHIGGVCRQIEVDEIAELVELSLA
jgi:hypothetical protein